MKISSAERKCDHFVRGWEWVGVKACCADLFKSTISMKINDLFRHRIVKYLFIGNISFNGITTFISYA